MPRDPFGLDDRPAPPVLDGTQLDADDEPTLVYIPSERVPHHGATTDTKVELRMLEDGRLALLAFSSLEQLVEGCGEHQPWIGVPSAQLEELRQAVEADVAVLDTSLSDDIRHPGGTDG